MTAVAWHERPALRDPLALIAFEGWGDAADAASGAVAYALGTLPSGEPFATIDPEEFFDFQARRPTIDLLEGRARIIQWPQTAFYAIRLEDQPRDLIIGLGEEPHLRWRTFSSLVLQILEEAACDDVITLGAFIGQVAHTLPVPLIGVSSDPDLVERHRLLASDYTGPTGIVGVINDALIGSGRRAVSLWAATPHYLAANANPAAMLALLEKALEIGGITMETSGLAAEADGFRTKVDRAIRESPALAARADDEEAGPEAGGRLVEEIERFLRDGE